MSVVLAGLENGICVYVCGGGRVQVGQRKDKDLGGDGRMHMNGCVSNIHICERVYNMGVILVAGMRQ